MIPRSNPLPEPPEPNAWLPTWAHRAAQEAASIASLEAALATAEAAADKTRIQGKIDARRAVCDSYAEKGDDPIWATAWFALPDLATGWRIRTLFDAMDKAKEGTILLPYYAAAIGLCWRASGYLLATKPPAGGVHRWTDDDLLAFGWKIVEELHAEGIGPSEVVEVGRVVRTEVDARLIPVGKREVGAKAVFFGRRPVTQTESSAKQV